MGNEMI